MINFCNRKTLILVIILYIENKVLANGTENHLPQLYANSEDQFVRFMDRVKFHGYTAEEHKVKSEDGYHLVLHRISGGPIKPPKFGKKVVYVQHGVLMSSDQFVINGPGQDFVYLLVDAGYDVWLGNMRGNVYSRSHDVISPENKTFWDFSFHEAAIYDVKAFIDYTLKVTRQKRFVYIGYSLGTAIGYVFFSSHPQYNEKVNLIISLGTVALWHHNKDPRVRVFRFVIQYIQKINHILKIYELLPSPRLLGRVTGNVCESGNFVKKLLCKVLFKLLVPKMDFNRVPKGSFKTMLKTFPSGTSTKNLFHLGQNIRSGNFSEYDYGKLNKEKYGTDVPPNYPLNKIVAPVAIYYGPNDLFGNINDLKDLRKSLPNVVVFKQINDTEFSHFDVILSGNARKILFDHFIELISEIHS